MKSITLGQTAFNVTIEDHSSTISYFPNADWSSVDGWAACSLYPGGDNVDDVVRSPPEDVSCHVTTNSTASLAFTFIGTSLFLYGMTNSPYQIYLDGEEKYLLSSSRGILAQFPSLSNNSHSVLIITKLSQDGRFAFDRAVVTDKRVPSPASMLRTKTYHDTDSWLKFAGTSVARNVRSKNIAAKLAGCRRSASEGSSASFYVGEATSTISVLSPSGLATRDAAQSPSSTTNLDTIAGVVAGGVVGLVLISVVMWWYCFKSRLRSPRRAGPQEWDLDGGTALPSPVTSKHRAPDVSKVIMPFRVPPASDRSSNMNDSTNSFVIPTLASTLERFPQRAPVAPIVPLSSRVVLSRSDEPQRITHRDIQTAGFHPAELGLLEYPVSESGGTISTRQGGWSVAPSSDINAFPDEKKKVRDSSGPSLPPSVPHYNPRSEYTMISPPSSWYPSDHPLLRGSNATRAHTPRPLPTPPRPA